MYRPNNEEFLKQQRERVKALGVRKLSEHIPDVTDPSLDLGLRHRGCPPPDQVRGPELPRQGGDTVGVQIHAVPAPDTDPGLAKLEVTKEKAPGLEKLPPSSFWMTIGKSSNKDTS